MNSQREAFEKWWIDLALSKNTPHWFTNDGKEAAKAAWQAATEQGVGDNEATNLCHWLYRAGYVTAQKERDYDPEGHEAFAACHNVMINAKPTGGGVPDDVIRQCEKAIDDAAIAKGGCSSGVSEAQKRVRSILLATQQPPEQESSDDSN